MTSKENIFETIIERYRYWIGGILILAIVGGSAVLIWRENYAKPSQESRIQKLESRIGQIEQAKSEVLDPKPETNQNVQNSTFQTEPEQGTVAGASSQAAGNSGILKQVQDDKKSVGKININTASATELDSLPGIGPTYAGRIVEYRNSRGGFKSIDEIKNVKGIGDKTFEKFKDQISCQEISKRLSE